MNLNYISNAQSKPKHRRNISIAETNICQILGIPCLADFETPINTIRCKQSNESRKRNTSRSLLKNALIEVVQRKDLETNTSTDFSCKYSHKFD